MTALTNRDSLQANLPAGIIVDTTFSDVQGLEHSNDGEVMVVGHSGGQTLLNFGYGKPVSYPTACCVACPWRTWYDNDEESDGDGASLSGDEKASLGEETNFAEKLAPPSPVLPVSAPCRRSWRSRPLHRRLRRPRRCIRRCLRPRCLCRCRRLRRCPCRRYPCRASWPSRSPRSHRRSRAAYRRALRPSRPGASGRRGRAACARVSKPPSMHTACHRPSPKQPLLPRPMVGYWTQLPYWVPHCAWRSFPKAPRRSPGSPRACRP
jgi:hypothetical protein